MGGAGTLSGAVCVRTYSFICVLIGAQSDKVTDNQSNKQTNIHTHTHACTYTPTAETNKHGDKQRRLGMAANKRHYPKSTAQTNHTH